MRKLLSTQTVYVTICNTFYEKIEPKWLSNIENSNKINKIVDAIKKEGKGKDFDCIMGMSGGIDSSYLLYLMKTKFDLRPLVFHVDAGWNSQIAVNNIEKLIDGLGLDLFTKSYRLGRDEGFATHILNLEFQILIHLKTMLSLQLCTSLQINIMLKLF